MHQFARSMGFISVASGVLLLVFPQATKRIMLARAEFALLSSGALRILGVWSLMMGALLVATTERELEAKLRDVASEARRTVGR